MMDRDEDILKTFQTDQAIAAIREGAIQVATFYNTLKEKSVPPDVALPLTIVWLQSLYMRIISGQSDDSD